MRMNVHSLDFGTAYPMTNPQASPDGKPDPAAERQTRILNAAERCFVRSGFHRTTMQDVAAEAGMSPGNLYRYFDSKDAVVLALAERDRARIGEDFAALSGPGDLLPALRSIAQKHFAEEPRERAVLCLEIWAEATRNQSFSSMSEAFDRDVCDRLCVLFRQAQASGAIAPEVDLEALAALIVTIANGLFVRRAVDAKLDAGREVASLMAVIEAAFAGKINLTRA
jgi:TetR/AcrR family transcriptional repressor of uid operon